MPTILRILGFRFFFYSNENAEPPHIHVEKGDGYGKYWLDPVEKDYMHNFTKKEEKQVEEIVLENQSFFKTKWHEFFS
jgi:Domain of unknown function (DUF4160)